MPVLDGLAVCRRLRAKGLPTPILMLTARDAVPDRVAGLEAGADDYLVKPFAVAGADRADLRALTRRGLRRPAAAVLRGPDARRATAHAATRAGRPIELTGREAALLELLLRERRPDGDARARARRDLGRGGRAERGRPLRHAAAAQARRAAADPDGPRGGLRAAGLSQCSESRACRRSRSASASPGTGRPSRIPLRPVASEGLRAARAGRRSRRPRRHAAARARARARPRAAIGRRVRGLAAEAG